MRGGIRAALLPHLAALGALACASGDRRDPTDFERMRQQQRYDLYEPSTVFPDGKTMQAPPAGTVPREATIGSPPLKSGAADLAQGRGRFEIYCAVCHGAGGFGGSVVASNMDAPRPPSLRTPAMRQQPDDFFFSVITRGVGRMPSYAWALSVPQRWAVIAYLRTLQAPHVPAPFETNDSLAAASLARLSPGQVKGTVAR